MSYLVSWIFPVPMKSNYTEVSTGKRWHDTWVQWCGRVFRYSHVERTA